MLSTLRQRNFALLWVAGLISITGDWVLFIGLPIYIYQLTQSTLATSAMFVAGVLPRLLFSSIAGVFVDRWDRRRTMVIANLLMGAVLLPLLLVDSVEETWIIYLALFFQSSISQFFGPAENALLPTLVAEEHLISANALNALNNNLARLVGPPIGGFAAVVFSLSGVAALDIVSYWLAALLISLIAVHAEPSAPGEKQRRRTLSVQVSGVLSEWLEGLRLIVREPRLRLLFLIAALPMIGEGVMGTLLVVFVSVMLGGGGIELGWLMSAQAVGGIIGSVLIGSVAKGVPLYRLMGISAVAFGLIDLMIFNYPLFVPSVWPGICLMVLVGIPAVGYGTGLTTMLQTATADQYRGRVFGAFSMIGSLLYLFGTILAGYLGEHLHVVAILNVQGLGYVVAGVLALVLLRRVYTTRYAPTTS
jgi:MFS family permease